MTLPTAADAASGCPISYGSADDAKPNKLYTYFPTAADAAFPEFGGAGFETSPLDPFDISLLPAYTGTLDQLRNAVRDVVVDDYCEFNVQVRQTTTSPPATFPRREIVGIGTDDNITGRWGRSDLVDTGDGRGATRPPRVPPAVRSRVRSPRSSAGRTRSAGRLRTRPGTATG